jgi:hypothetical protein
VAKFAAFASDKLAALCWAGAIGQQQPYSEVTDSGRSMALSTR